MSRFALFFGPILWAFSVLGSRVSTSRANDIGFTCCAAVTMTLWLLHLFAYEKRLRLEGRVAQAKRDADISAGRIVLTQDQGEHK